MPQRPLAAVVSPLGAFGEKAPREHRIRVRSQRSERLQFPALSPQLKSWRAPTEERRTLFPADTLSWQRRRRSPYLACAKAAGIPPFATNKAHPSTEMWPRLPLVIVIPLAAIVLVVLYVTYRLVDPLPPRHLAIAAGMAGSGYDNFARQYARILARDGVGLEVRNAAAASVKALPLGCLDREGLGDGGLQRVPLRPHDRGRG